MTQQQLIERLAERTQTTKAEAKRNLEALTTIIAEALQNENAFNSPTSAVLKYRNLLPERGAIPVPENRCKSQPKRKSASKPVPNWQEM